MSLVPSSAYGVTQEELAQAAAELETLGAQLSSLQSELDTANGKLSEAEEASAQKDAEVETVRADLEDRRTALSERLRSDYKLGSSSLLDYVVGADSVEGLLTRVYYASCVNQQRADLIAEVQENEARLEKEQGELATIQAEQKEQVDKLLTLVEDYQAKVSAAASVYDALDAQAQEELIANASDSVSVAVEAVEESKETNNSGSSSSSSNNGNTSNSSNASNQNSSSSTSGKGESTSGNHSSSVDPSLNNDPNNYTGGSDNVSRSRDSRLGTVTWSGDSGYLNGMIKLANQYGSSTGWFLTFDNELLRFCALQKSGSSWVVVKTWNCIGAKATYNGKWSVLHKRESNWYSETTDWFQNGNGPNAWSTDYIWGIRSSWSKNHERWVTSPYGSGYEDCAAIHGAGTDPNRGLDKSNRGCCGLLNANAKWVYDNIPVGSTVYEFEYSRVGVF